VKDYSRTCSARVFDRKERAAQETEEEEEEKRE